MEADDIHIISAALQGEEAAFEALIRGWSRKLHAIAYGILQDHQESEDIVQECFVKAYRGRRQVKDPEKFPAWLGQICRNAALDRYRKRKRTTPLEVLPEREAESGEAEPDKEAAKHHLTRFISELPEDYRVALNLRYMEGLDYAAIEQTMGVSNGALRGILGRAMGILRKRMRFALAGDALRSQKGGTNHES